MRVLVTGANGFVGAALAKRLAARGDEVRCLVRDGSDRSPLEGARISFVSGDVTSPQTLPFACENADVVYHLAGIRRATTRDEFMRVNAEGTRNVADAMVRAGAKRLVLAGSLAASGSSVGGRPRREDDPFSPEEWYGESKAEAERIAFSIQDRLEVTSIRPARIVGPGDKENLAFFKIVKRGWVLRVGGGVRRLSVVDVDDTIDQLILQGERPEAVGQAFFNASPEITSVEELMRTIASALGVQPKTLPLPEAVLRGFGAVADVISNATGRRLPLNRKLARQLLAPGWVCSVEKAERLLGFVAKRSIQDAIERSARSYIEAKWL